MKYIEAFAQLEDAATHFAFKSTTGQWRLQVRERSARTNDAVYVELQHWVTRNVPSDGFWYGVAHLSCDITAAREEGVTLTTYINCTMCGKWSQESPKARGLKQLFDLADMFEDFTRGKTFDV